MGWINREAVDTNVNFEVASLGVEAVNFTMAIPTEGGKRPVPEFQFRKARLIFVKMVTQDRWFGLAVLQALLTDVFEQLSIPPRSLFPTTSVVKRRPRFRI